MQRKDDTRESFATRLDAYQKSTAPLIDFYKKQGILGEVDGLQDIDAVFGDIRKILERS